jgi:glutathione S-transferase
MVINCKKINDKIVIKTPTEIGGLKSAEYLSLNSQGKMPLMVTNNGMAIPESDTICRYLLEKYPEGPSFNPKNLQQKMLSEQISRTHDIYIAPVQGCMYKAPGTSYSIYGTDRLAALSELKKQLQNIERAVTEFDLKNPSLAGNFLCGEEISLGDASLYPTVVFCMFILPQFFELSNEDILGPRLLRWFNYLSKESSEAKGIREEIESALSGWKSNNRWDKIVEELKALKV